MNKNMYEIFDEFEEASSKKDKMKVIEKNLSKTLVQVLELTFHPGYQWLVNDIPENYKVPDTLPGISRTQLYTEFRRIYLFQKGHPTADGLSPEKRKNLLTQILEGLEPDDAQVFVDVLRKDLQIQDLTPEIINKAFPNLL